MKKLANIRTIGSEKMIKFDTSKIYYLAHPCTGGPYCEKDNRQMESINSSYLSIVNPEIKLVRPLTIIPKDMDYDIAMNRCYKLLDACDVILLCDGWDKSKGCLLEYEYATKHDIEIIGL